MFDAQHQFNLIEGQLRFQTMASKDILVCGTLNLETTFPITRFPLDYEPVSYRLFEIKSQPSGVGFNIARALSTLGNQVRFVSIVGSDFLGTALRQSMARFGMSDEFILPILNETPQSIVIFDGAGRRMVNTDLKEVGERAYSVELFKRALQGSRAAVMTNVGFSRPLLSLAKAASGTVATDLQTASEGSQKHDADFLSAADVVFMSHEKLPVEPKDFVSTIWERSAAQIAVAGMGAAGALLGVRGREVCQVPAVQVRPVVNTAGAGDALFSCFLHFYLDGDEPILALRKATVFAAYKIGEIGSSLGFLPEDELRRLFTPFGIST
jgi:sugar/nucleoside kinase (ribokinase family)